MHDDRHDVDEERDRILAGLGVRVLRVRNEEVLDDLDGVVRCIAAALHEQAASRSPRPGRV